MAKRTSKKTTPRKKAARGKRSKKDPPLPGPHFSEQMMQSIFGSRDTASSAQEYAYEAMDAMANGDWDRACELAMKAAKLDSECVDALHILSELGSENEEELIDNLRRTVERGAGSLGKKFFQENEGFFWGLLETRPYMRARAQLASTLNESGKIDEAVEHYEEMLRLNPNDNQGLRYSLLGCYLELGNLKGAARLFSDYSEEGSAMFAWAKILAHLIAGDENAATATLIDARSTNKYVEAYLAGRKKMPANGPDYYSPGEESEAFVCMHEIGKAWNMHPRAIDWLKRQKTKRK